MKDPKKGILGRWDVSGEEIRQCIALGVAEAVREHKAAGRSIVCWDRETQAVVIVPAEEIVIPDLAEIAHASNGNDSTS